MKLLKHAQEVLTWPYYREHPVQALQYTYAKWLYSKAKVATPVEFLARLGLRQEAAFESFDKWRPLLNQVIENVRAKQGHQGGVSIEDGMVLYGVTRALKPDYMIETGVAAGVSNSFINAALIENGKGQLYSIELPPAASGAGVHADGGVFAWPQTGVGWAVPAEIREAIGTRNELILEDARTALPALLERLPHVDIFFHDDLHTPEHMLWEYRLVWPYLKSGGMLLSDDSDFGWIKFCREQGMNGHSALNMQRLTAVSKP